MNTKLFSSLNRTSGHPIFAAAPSSSSTFPPNKPHFSPCSYSTSSGAAAQFSPLPIADKPFHISSLRRRLAPVCNAYEAGQSLPVDISIELPAVAGEQAAQKVKIGLYFATWWALNVVFNIYNKKVLNAFPYPWLTSTLSLACGSLMMLVSWAARVADAPEVDLEVVVVEREKKVARRREGRRRD